MDEFRVRPVAHAPRHEINNRQLGFARAWRDINNQAGALSYYNALQRIAYSSLVTIQLHLRTLSGAEHGLGECQQVCAAIRDFFGGHGAALVISQASGGASSNNALFDMLSAAHNGRRFANALIFAGSVTPHRISSETGIM